MESSRRRFIQTGLALTAGCTTLSGLKDSYAADTEKRSIGLQLYAVRGEFERDVPGTLKKVAELGYEGVEFWGYKGTTNVYKDYDAEQLRKLLDDNGLKCCGMHLMVEALSIDCFMKTVENNKILGNSYLIVAAASDLMKTEESIKSLAAILNRASGLCRRHKMKVGYHAHGFDFEKIDGKFAWEILFSQAGPDVVMQMDVGNCLSGGGDPLAMLKKFPGRTQTIHVKEYEDKTFDSDYYSQVFKLCETSCGTRWYIVEMGGDEGLGFDIPQKALGDLRKLGK